MMNLEFDEPLKNQDSPKVDLGFERPVRLTKDGPWVLQAFGEARLTEDEPCV